MPCLICNRCGERISYTKYMTPEAALLLHRCRKTPGMVKAGYYSVTGKKRVKITHIEGEK